MAGRMNLKLKVRPEEAYEEYEIAVEDLQLL